LKYDALTKGLTTVVNAMHVLQQQARRQQELVNERRKRKLLPVARALVDPLRSQEIVRVAMGQVLLWRKNQLCSPDYIDAWEGLLKRPQEAARVLQDSSPYADQLRQNSPFVAVVRKMQGLNAA
jgi:hypothetical protein